MELTALQQLVHQMYIAYYQRPADPDGLQYWVDQLEQNGDWTAVSAAFGAPENEENQALYGDLNREQTIAAIYQSAFNREAVAEEVAFWAASEFSATDLTFAIVNGAQNSDKATVDNKVAFSAELVAQVGTNAAYAELQDPKALLTAVTEETEVTAGYVSDAVASGKVGETFSLTADVDDLVGTANDDAFAAGLTVAGTQTLQNFDTIDGGAGTDSLTATLTGGTVAPTLTSVENIFARSVTGASELDLQNATGVEQVWTDRSQNDLTVSNLDSLSTIGAQNIARSTGHTYTVRYDANTVAAADTQAIVLNNAALNLAVEQGAVGAELNTVRNVSIASEGDANAVTFISDTAVETNLVDSAAVQNITITGAADLTVASQDDGTNTTALTAGTIDASEATGDVSITIADAAGTNLATGVTQRTVTMGAGDDIVDASGANLANSKIVGGEGRDTIIVDGASTTLVDDLVANVSGFEVLNLAGLTQTVSAATMGNIGFESIVATNANTGSVTNLTAESDLTLVNTNAGADSITLSVAGAATNDNAELNFATVGANGNNSTFNVTVADVENLNVSTSATDADTFRSTELSVTSTELENLTVTGNEAVIFDGTGNTALKSVDVSGVTASNATDGDLTADITVDDGVTVTGSAGDDKITFGESNEITGGAGEDVFVASIVSVTAAGAPLFSTITDLKANEDDSIEFGAAGTVLSTATTGTDVNIITEADLGLAPGVNATFANFLNAASELTAGTVSGFEFAGNTYVVQDNEGTATTFNAATDFIVELTGSVDRTEFTYA